METKILLESIVYKSKEKMEVSYRAWDGTARGSFYLPADDARQLANRIGEMITIEFK